ncbi:MAG: phage Gp37/Gp68 family protein [Candidatus Marinimicrobia bacterium]|nr:phage Gp37/Gp68 family protein [Candidatus Neomarinimicrobiota bacterium]
MSQSAIEWTESTWNPVTGCSKVSSGCKNCYAERMANRLRAMGQANYKNGFKVTLHPHTLDYPQKWSKSQMIFVNSMSDLFHEDVPVSFIQNVFEEMNNARWHTFQVLTKRSERLLELNSELTWADNIWMGVSVEDSKSKHRIQDLHNTNAKVKFLSCEPLLGSLIPLGLDGIDWVIVGGESGPGSRLIDAKWVYEIRDACNQSKTPFFFKQWGGTRKKKTGRILDDRTWDELPMQFNIRR